MMYRNIYLIKLSEKNKMKEKGRDIKCVTLREKQITREGDQICQNNSIEKEREAFRGKQICHLGVLFHCLNVQD